MQTMYGDLEIQEDMAFQRRSWKVERASWIVMGVIILVSVLGLTGAGPLSRTRVGDPATLRIEFQRFTHAKVPTRLEITVAVAGPSALELPDSYLSRAEVLHVVPRPDRAESRDGLVIYTWSGGPGTAKVLVDLKFRQLGAARGFVRSRNARVDFVQHVYP